MSTDHSTPQPMDEEEYKTIHDGLLAAFQSMAEISAKRQGFGIERAIAASSATAKLADTLMRLNDRKPRM